MDFKDLLRRFESSDALQQWAERWNLMENEHMMDRWLNLRAQEVISWQEQWKSDDDVDGFDDFLHRATEDWNDITTFFEDVESPSSKRPRTSQSKDDEMMEETPPIPTQTVKRIDESNGQNDDDYADLALACVLDGSWHGSLESNHEDRYKDLALACALDGSWHDSRELSQNDQYADLPLACALDGSCHGSPEPDHDDQYEDLVEACNLDGSPETPKPKSKGKGWVCPGCGKLFTGKRGRLDYVRHKATCSPIPSTSSIQEGGSATKRSEDPQKTPTRNGSSSETRQPYTFRLRSEKTFSKRAAIQRVYEVKFDEQWRGELLSDLEASLRQMFDDVIRRARGHLADNDLGCVVIRHNSLTNPIVVPLRKLEFLDGKTVLEYIAKVLTSHDQLKLDTSFHVDVGVIELPKGGHKPNIIDPHKAVDIKKSIVQIRNQDNLCLARAIAVCLVKACDNDKKKWEDLVAQKPGVSWADLVLKHKVCSPRLYTNLKNRTSTTQTTLATRLTELAGLPLNRKVSLADIAEFERVLDVRILVVSAEMGNAIIRKGETFGTKNQLFVYHVETDQHFHAITKILGFFNRNYWCDNCLQAYNKRGSHQCETHCMVCKRSKCKVTASTVFCQDCNMTARSRICYDVHKKKRMVGKQEKPSECDTWKKCRTCRKLLKVTERSLEHHVCGEYKCNFCKTYVPEDHKCYHHPKIEPETDICKFIFFDFECRQSSVFNCSEGYLPSPCKICQDPATCHHQPLCDNCHSPACGKMEHVPNFVIAQSVCDVCKEEAMDIPCASCGSRCQCCNQRNKKTKAYLKDPCTGTCGKKEVVFKGDATNTDFCEWLFSDEHRGYTVYAHNFQGYDGYFILSYLIEHSILPGKIIYNGSKIMSMQIERGLNIRLVDSLSFFSTSLAKLPELFKLDEMKKGYFPHYFNLPENQAYIGPYPDPSAYGLEFMSTKGRTKFLKWYETKTDESFDFAHEMEAYCRSDVDILQRVMMAFRDMLISITRETETVIDSTTGQRVEQMLFQGVDPTKSITIASVCMEVFQQKFLKPYYHIKLSTRDTWLPLRKGEDGKTDTVLYNGDWVSIQQLESQGLLVVEEETLPSPIAIVPSEGYVQKDQFSQASIQWLEWISHNQRLTIQHALNDGEFSLPGHKYKADGYCEASNTVYQYDGCLFHGCPKCFPHKRDATVLPRTQQTIAELYALTLKRDDFWRSRGFRVEQIWEHEFQEQLKNQPNTKQFVQSLDLQMRLDPRDSFFGGRTNAMKLFYEAEENEEILYQDFTSLYPSVNKYGRYPVGHPEIITRDFGPLSQYFGMAKVKVSAPRKLYHPVLPYRSNGKLKFALCRTCADKEKSEGSCNHAEEERCFIGTWCTPELEKAVEKGYEIIKIYEVYHWSEVMEYNSETNEEGLFSGYINSFLKLKQQASGYPVWCITEEDKKKYVQKYKEKEGISLDADNIEKNPGLRALSKIICNSFWGKFGQRANMTQSQFIHEHQVGSFFLFLTDPSKEIHNFHILTDRVLQMQWSLSGDAFVPESKCTNIFIASFTTCHARLKLYSLLDMVGQRTLYMDTDSIVFTSKPGEVNPPLGDYLGELTDELDGDSIQTFVSGGPKNYAYKTKTGKEVCKVRGFTLNHVNAQLINFSSVKDMILAEYKREEIVMTNVSPTRPSPNKSPSKKRKRITVTNPSKISRDKLKSKIYNRSESKGYRIVYTKRAVQPNLDTLPFGY